MVTMKTKEVKTTQLLLRGLPPELKTALMAAAEHANSNLQSVAIAMLAEEFKVKYEISHHRATQPHQDVLRLNLRVPEDLHRKIRLRAADQRIAYSDVAVKALGAKLGVAIPPEYVDRRGKKAA